MPPFIMDLNLTPSLSRILALDLGKKRIGLALSDPLRITAQGLPNLVRTNNRADLEALGEVVRERGVGLILMGRYGLLNAKQSNESRTG